MTERGFVLFNFLRCFTFYFTFAGSVFLLFCIGCLASGIIQEGFRETHPDADNSDELFLEKKQSSQQGCIKGYINFRGAG